VMCGQKECIHHSADSILGGQERDLAAQEGDRGGNLRSGSSYIPGRLPTAYHHHLLVFGQPQILGRQIFSHNLPACKLVAPLHHDARPTFRHALSRAAVVKLSRTLKLKLLQWTKESKEWRGGKWGDLCGGGGGACPARESQIKSACTEGLPAIAPVGRSPGIQLVANVFLTFLLFLFIFTDPGKRSASRQEDTLAGGSMRRRCGRMHHMLIRSETVPGSPGCEASRRIPWQAPQSQTHRCSRCRLCFSW